MRNDILFVAEGIFDACRLTNLGMPAVALLSNVTKKDMKNWFGFLNRKIIAVVDNDGNKNNKKLAMFGDFVYTPTTKDLGDATDAEVKQLIEKYT